MDGTTQVVKPSADYFEDWKTFFEMRDKVISLVQAIAGQRLYNSYVSTYTFESKTKKLRKR